MTMIKAITVVALTISFAMSASEAASALLNMDLVMKSTDAIGPITDEAKYPTYRNNRCTVRFPGNGNFATHNGFLTGGWDSNQNGVCSVKAGITYTLQPDGNFVTYCGGVPSYSTLTAQSVPSDGYFLAIDDNCVLHLFDGKWISYSGTLGSKTVIRQELTMRKELWTNVRQELKVGDRLVKGDYVAYADDKKLLLQSSDGNLVVYQGETAALWAASNEWSKPPASNLKGFYAKVTSKGHLVLVGIDYTTSKETIYFDKTLANYNGQKCFTVQYDATTKNLKAVTCPTSRRNLLRSSS